MSVDNKVELLIFTPEDIERSRHYLQMFGNPDWYAQTVLTRMGRKDGQPMLRFLCDTAEQGIKRDYGEEFVPAFRIAVACAYDPATTQESNNVLNIMGLAFHRSFIQAAHDSVSNIIRPEVVIKKTKVLRENIQHHFPDYYEWVVGKGGESEGEELKVKQVGLVIIAGPVLRKAYVQAMHHQDFCYPLDDQMWLYKVAPTSP